MMLSQLDAGVDERIMLVSRDEQSCLVVSYKEIKSCIDMAFRYIQLLFHSITVLRGTISDLARASSMR